MFPQEPMRAKHRATFVAVTRPQPRISWTSGMSPAAMRSTCATLVKYASAIRKGAPLWLYRAAALNPFARFNTNPAAPTSNNSAGAIIESVTERSPNSTRSLSRSMTMPVARP